jgi:hypothetical protein
MFAGSTFDGMRDLKEHHRTLITTDDGAELVQFHCDFVFAERSISPEWREELLQEMEETHGGPVNPEGSLPYRTLRAADAERLGCQVGALWPDDSRSEFVGVLIHQMAAGRVR